MARALSSYDYRGFLADPETLRVPTNFVVAPLPVLAEPAHMATLSPGAAHSGEPLVEISHRRVRCLSTYWHAGWDAAVPQMMLRAGAAERLYAAAQSLPEGFGLAVLDAWRPLGLQREIFEAAYADASLPAGFVSEPSSDPATPPPHATGGTVDVTLTWQQQPLALGSEFDDFIDEARTAAFEAIPGRVRVLRRLLFHAMCAQGWRVIDCEWWHFEYGTRRWGALVGQPAFYPAAEPR